MGTYLNPGFDGFARIAGSEYVDKTGLIGLINRTIDTSKNLICISRPRRFGKSYAAQMLCAYYDETCDSHHLFDGYEIAGDSTYEEYINRYHVLSLDVSGFIAAAKQERRPLSAVPSEISRSILKELKTACLITENEENLNDGLLFLVRSTKKKIVFVIDEWDSLIREAKNDSDTQEAYLNLLRGWFKNNNFTPEAVAAAYMTGILPIKKDGSQSAISDFKEYSVIEPLDYAGYDGFTEEEVKELCRKHDRSFAGMKYWYDGYTIGECHSIYNPYSVMQALEGFTSYIAIFRKLLYTRKCGKIS